MRIKGIIGKNERDTAICDYNRKVAFIMPGQGKYDLETVNLLYYRNRNINEKFKDEQNRKIIDYLLNKKDGEDLSNIDLQSIIYISNIVISMMLINNGIHPDALAGFSAGEISALAIGGAFSVDEGLRIITNRAKLMQLDIDKRESMMVAVFNIKKEVIENICLKIENVYIANINSPYQIVLALEKKEYKRVKSLVYLEGGKLIPLNLAGAFHSKFFGNAARAFYESIEKVDIEIPIINTYSNYTGNVYNDRIKYLMAKQVDNRVEWQKEIMQMKEDGITCFIETSVYCKLSRLIQETISDVEVINYKKIEELMKI